MGYRFMAGFFPGLQRASEKIYSDIRRAGQARDADLERQPRLAWYMDRYPSWRELYDGTALEEKISTSQDPGTDSDQDTYRWPVRYNLIKAYCQLHASMLWGRGRTGADASDLFEIRVDPKVPFRVGPPATDTAKRMAELYQFFWCQQTHILRPLGVIQQWAGGCIIKVAWNPWADSAVFGIQLETIQPEHFYPIFDPLNVNELVAVKLKFSVSKAVAIAKYGLTPKQLESAQDPNSVPVEEYWDRQKFYIKLLKYDPDDKGVVAIRPSDRARLEGDNPWKHPTTGVGIIPFVYVPRIRDGHFFGDSLAYNLEGVQNELNKTLADYGDALTRGSHPPFGISDFTGTASKTNVVQIPRHGALNMGKTKPGGTAPKVHQFPAPAVPPQTGEFTNLLLSLSENTAGLTPAAKGLAQSGKSGLAIAMEMLPTTNLVDWERAHWEHAIAGPGGLNTIMAIIWWNKSKGTDFAPSISQAAFGLRNRCEFRPVVPRDRIEIIDEVVRLATAKAVSPQEWLRRLGDVEDIDQELWNLIAFLAWEAQVQAAVAGRAVEIDKPTNPENPAEALPEITGKTVEPAPKQPATQPQGQTRRDRGETTK